MDRHALSFFPARVMFQNNRRNVCTRLAACMTKVTGNTAYADVARGVLRYVLRDMTDEAGGFYSAEDADSLPFEGATEKKEVGNKSSASVCVPRCALHSTNHKTKLCVERAMLECEVCLRVSCLWLAWIASADCDQWI